MTVAGVKAWLREYTIGERDMFTEMERLETLIEKMENPGSPELTDMPKAPSPPRDRIGLLLARKEGLEKRIARIIDFQEKRRAEIEILSEILCDPDERAVIRMHYLDGDDWKVVNAKLFGNCEDFLEKFDSYMKRVFRTHGDALTELARIMTERGITQ